MCGAERVQISFEVPDAVRRRAKGGYIGNPGEHWGPKVRCGRESHVPRVHRPLIRYLNVYVACRWRVDRLVRRGRTRTSAVVTETTLTVMVMAKVLLVMAVQALTTQRQAAMLTTQVLLVLVPRLVTRQQQLQRPGKRSVPELTRRDFYNIYSLAWDRI